MYELTEVVIDDPMNVRFGILPSHVHVAVSVTRHSRVTQELILVKLTNTCVLQIVNAHGY